MKQYLIDTFRFNDWANKQVLEKIRQLPEPGEAIRLFSHLINSQDKWMARINGDACESQMSWLDPPYEIGALESEWNESLERWLDFLERLPESVQGFSSMLSSKISALLSLST